MAIQLKGGTAAQGAVVNPVLAARQLGVETDTGRIKVGDGVTAWNVRGYSGAAASKVTNRVMYVSAIGSDSYDGLGPGSAKLTLAAAYAALGAGVSGKIILGVGDIPVGAEFLIDRPGMVIEGSGFQTNLVCSAAMTNVVKVSLAGRCILRDFRITVGNGGAVTNGLLVNAPVGLGATQTTLLYNVFVDRTGTGTMVNAITFGDVAGDTSEISVFGARVSGASGAGFKLGGVSTPNVLNFRFYGCDSRNNAYGVDIGGSGLTWIGGTTQWNTSADFKLTNPGSAPIRIQGIRSENSKRFWECESYGTDASSVHISDVHLRAPTDAAGKHIVHYSSVGLILDNFQVAEAAVTSAFDITAEVLYPGSVYAVNVVTQSDDPFGAMPNINATIINLRKRNVDGRSVPVSTGNVTRFGERISASRGIATKIKAGVLTDADFGSTPADGTLAVNTSTSRMSWRSGGSWFESGLDSDAASELLAAGEFIPRRDRLASYVSVASGVLVLAYFTAKRSETVSSLTVYTGTVAAGATPTVCRLGLYEIAANGDATLVASTPNDTTLFSATFTAYQKSLSVPFAKVAGQRYATAYLIVTAAAVPTLHGSQMLATSAANGIHALGPQVFGQRTAADLPASMTAPILGVAHAIGMRLVV